MSPASKMELRATRILVVDDERDNRELLDLILTWEGFVVRTAASGEEALASVSEQHPELILLDVMMPGMDGFQVAAKIKGDAATRDISIIMVTALADREARKRGTTAGAEDFLTKPLDREDLVLRVKNVLYQRARRLDHTA